MPTMKDVAKAAGVSVTTVSHVINETRFVSEELRSRVNRVMEELNYHPNTLARSLRLGITHTIALIVPDNSNPFFAEVSRVAEMVGFENDFSVILCNSDKNVDREAAYLEMLTAKQVDGIIFIAAGSSQEHLESIAAQGIPVVVADREVPQTLADVVLVNHEQGGYDATRYLLSLGHRRVACIAGPARLTPSSQRVQGYRRALAEAGIAIDEELVVSCTESYVGGEIAMAHLLRLDRPPTAVFTYNDVTAIGALRAARNVGVDVPGDLSIVGFDDIALASATVPALTTVAQPIADLATIATELLIERIRNVAAGRPGRRVVLDTKLVVRESCAPPRK
ncbi:MAG: LacI family transcriptional regulator [Chloroflexi bacterium]|nr:LacI family transcriptional regulator [Chloroflexota bacterium]